MADLNVSRQFGRHASHAEKYCRNRWCRRAIFKAKLSEHERYCRAANQRQWRKS